ncbi:CRISPR-associated endonuclease Cas2 [Vibrio sp. PNB23_22_6]|uniref:CRISPR-associated endonuclease Cas2 n=1 Tax=unclassified Vibrio TaxID=2614977 RepID=UPI000C026587|nr:CRISPR-associated endonuclease Cas2 [Vibrio sp. PID17_43]PHJ42202.1 hypothetical protein AK965_06755 [Vibrio sp. PID17_43]
MSGEHFVICYDISDRRARYHVEKELLGYGERVQYSVFECRLSQAEFLRLRATLVSYIADSDKINYYRLCSHCQRRRLTQGSMIAWQSTPYEYIDG